MKTRVNLNILLILTLAFISSITIYAQDTIVNFNGPQFNTANMESTNRLLDVPSFPCSCDCSTMVKSAIIYDEQGDDELQLVGGWIDINRNDIRCQRIELNLSACNNQSITSINITFPESIDDCLDKDFYLFRDDGTTPMTNIGSFDPLTETGQLTLSPPLAPCSSKKVVFYICSENMGDCEADYYSIDVDVGGQNPACEKTMTWHFDFMPSVPDEKFYIDLDKEKMKEENQKVTTYYYKIIDVYSNTIQSGIINNLSEIINLKNRSSLGKGLYIMQIYHQSSLIQQEKFIKGY